MQENKKFERDALINDEKKLIININNPENWTINNLTKFSELIKIKNKLLVLNFLSDRKKHITLLLYTIVLYGLSKKEKLSFNKFMEIYNTKKIKFHNASNKYLFKLFYEKEMYSQNYPLITSTIAYNVYPYAIISHASYVKSPWKTLSYNADDYRLINRDELPYKLQEKYEYTKTDKPYI